MKEFKLTTLQMAQLENIKLRMRLLQMEEDQFIRGAITDHFGIEGKVEIQPDGVLRITATEPSAEPSSTCASGEVQP